MVGVPFDVGSVPYNPYGWGPMDSITAANNNNNNNLPLNVPFAADSADDDNTFRLVDGKPRPRPKFGPKWRYQQQKQLPQRRDEEVEARKREAEKRERRLERYKNANFFKVTTTDDPGIRKLANDDKAMDYAIDTILSALRI